MPELYAIVYFAIGLVLLGIVMGVMALYALYLDKRKSDNNNSMDAGNNRTGIRSFDIVGGKDWKQFG